MSIQNSDYVLSVKKDASEKELSSLISTLLVGGFRCRSRPGSAQSTLLFVQLSTLAFTELVQQDLIKCFECGVTVKDDAPADRSLLIYGYLTESKQTNGLGITTDKSSIVESIMPISGYLADASIAARTKKSVFAASLKTTGIQKIYGTGIALYFEFLKHYIGYLVLLSIMGTIAYVKSKQYSMAYTYINLVGGVLFILSWKRRERYLASTWGVQNSHKLVQNNAELAALNKNFEVKSTYKHLERKDGSRFIKQWAFVPVALAFVAVLFTFQMTCFALEIFMSEIYDGPLKVFLKLVPTVALAVFVPILTIVYNLVVEKFLGWESHNNKYTRYDSFLAKTFILNFLTGYVPLLVTSFVYLPFAHLVENYIPDIERSINSTLPESKYMLHYFAKVKRQEDFIMNQDRLNSQFFFFMVTNQIIQLLLKYVLPLVLPKIINLVMVKVLKKQPEAPIKDSADESKWLGAVRTALTKPEFNLHDDFRALALQFGYLSMFGPVWTLAPLVCLFFNVLVFKLDTLKLANGQYFRPPVPSRTDLIHPWDQAFIILAWAGSVVSPVVTAFYRNGTKPPKTLGQFALDKASVNISSSVMLMLTLFFSEHLFFALYLVGSKAFKLVLSKEEELTNFLDNDLRVRKDYYSNLVELKTDANEANDWKEQSVEEVIQSARSTSLRDSSDGAKLRARKGKSDRIIDVVDSAGNKTEAIIDGLEHIPMKDVTAIEKKLAANAKAKKSK